MHNYSKLSVQCCGVCLCTRLKLDQEGKTKVFTSLKKRGGVGGYEMCTVQNVMQSAISHYACAMQRKYDIFTLHLAQTLCVHLACHIASYLGTVDFQKELSGSATCGTKFIWSACMNVLSTVKAGSTFFF